MGLVVEVAGGSQVVEGGSEGDFVVVSRFCFRGFVSKAWKGMVEVGSADAWSCYWAWWTSVHSVVMVGTLESLHKESLARVSQRARSHGHGQCNYF